MKTAIKIGKFVLCVAACDAIGTSLGPEVTMPLVERLVATVSGIVVLAFYGRA